MKNRYIPPDADIDANVPRCVLVDATNNKMANSNIARAENVKAFKPNPPIEINKIRGQKKNAVRQMDGTIVKNLFIAIQCLQEAVGWRIRRR
jgi:hypothetical protein